MMTIRIVMAAIIARSWHFNSNDNHTPLYYYNDDDDNSNNNDALQYCAMAVPLMLLQWLIMTESCHAHSSASKLLSKAGDRLDAVNRTKSLGSKAHLFHGCCASPKAILNNKKGRELGRLYAIVCVPVRPSAPQFARSCASVTAASSLCGTNY